MENKNWHWVKKELFWSVLLPLVFLLISIAVRFLFIENAYPTDYETIDSYSWANIFIYFYIVSSISCILYHVYIAVMGVKKNIHSRAAWVAYGIIGLVASVLVPVYISVRYREESFCTLIMYLMFILEYAVTFVVSTHNAPRNWDFCLF